MRSAEEVALYAILLREAAANRHLSEEAIFDDMACDEDNHICFATYLALAHFSELDWQMVDVLCNYPQEVMEVAGKLYEQEQMLEAEALLHAVLPNGKKSRAQWPNPCGNAGRRYVHPCMRTNVSTSRSRWPMFSRSR
jgi:hypothetical protein